MYQAEEFQKMFASQLDKFADEDEPEPSLWPLEPNLNKEQVKADQELASPGMDADVPVSGILLI